jgi:hypothetical protein
VDLLKIMLENFTVNSVADNSYQLGEIFKWILWGTILGSISSSLPVNLTRHLKGKNKSYLILSL